MLFVEVSYADEAGQKGRVQKSWLKTEPSVVKVTAGFGLHRTGRGQRPTLCWQHFKHPVKLGNSGLAAQCESPLPARFPGLSSTESADLNI